MIATVFLRLAQQIMKLDGKGGLMNRVVDVATGIVLTTHTSSREREMVVAGGEGGGGEFAHGVWSERDPILRRCETVRNRCRAAAVSVGKVVLI
jgi:hypothetical protein